MDSPGLGLDILIPQNVFLVKLRLFFSSCRQCEIFLFPLPHLSMVLFSTFSSVIICSPTSSDSDYS